MVKYNTKKQTAATADTQNLAGGEAFSETPKLELVSLMLTSFVKSQYYRKEEETVAQLKKAIDKIADKLFVAKAAVFARNKFGMRSITHIAAGEVAQKVKGAYWTRAFFKSVIHRPDDMLEVVSYFLKNYGVDKTNSKGRRVRRPLPNALKDGLASAFEKFDAYQLAKYRGEGKEVSLIDLVRLVRPKPTRKNHAALQKLVKGELVSADTWETKLTQAGQKAENAEEKLALKSEAWHDLLVQKKLGYMAAMRNARNIIETGDAELVTMLCAVLENEKMIKQSLVLPFRFQTAIEELGMSYTNILTKQVIASLTRAMETSLSNVPKLEGRTLIAVDGSGSMAGQPIKIASIFAAAMYKTNDADLMLFSDSAKYVSFNTMDSMSTIAKSIERKCACAGTNFHSIFGTAREKYDRIIILSDMQAWSGGWNAPTEDLKSYNRRHKASPHVYSFDLQGYGTLQFPESKVYALTGWSEKIFDIMAMLEQDREALIHEIEAVTF